jgi:hypothetical protein
LASTAISKDVITVIAQELSCAVDRSVEYWMAQLDEVLTDTRLTTLGRLNSVSAIVARYKHFTGKSQLRSRHSSDPI